MDVKANFRFESLDGLHGLLVLYVMYHHFALVFDSAMMAGNSVLQAFASSGALGVRCFFIISGFVIFHQMHRRWLMDPKPIQNFYIRRFFRIIPLWWLVVLLYAIFHKLDASVIGLNLTFLFGFVMYDRTMMPVPQSWSLFVEEFFYILFPWLYRNIISVRGALLGLILSLVVASLWRTFASFLGVPTTNYFIEYFPLANMPFFFRWNTDLQFDT